MSMTQKKQHLIQDLNNQVRLMSGSSVLFSHVIADNIGINSTDMECLDFLVIHGTSTAGKLAELTGLTTGAITAMVDRLEKASFVKRTFDKNDRRRVLVEPDIKKINKEIGKYMLSMANSFNKEAEEFTEEELIIILKFVIKANQIAKEEIVKLKSK